MLAIGLMSGTSLDGIDVSLIRTNGEDKLELISDYHQPFDKKFRDELRALLADQKEWWKLERQLTLLHADAVKHMMEKEKKHGRVELIGFHGQTISHKPNEHFTWQLGDPNLLASLVRCDVVGDFRRRDVAYGGQGAPFVPVYHRALLDRHGVDKPVLVVNIGGVANFTYVDYDNELVAFDCGPGNALIDDACAKLFDVPFDEQGRIASRGRVHREIVEAFLCDEFFPRHPPKSLDRNHFLDLISDGKLDELSSVDRISTISFFTVASIVYSIREHFIKKGKHLKQVLVCGGGAKNQFLMKSLAEELPSWIKRTNIQEINPYGLLNPDFIESQAFAYLAVRFFRRLPASLPTTTGVSEAVTGGAYFPFK